MKFSSILPHVKPGHGEEYRMSSSFKESDSLELIVRKLHTVFSSTCVIFPHLGGQKLKNQSVHAVTGDLS